MTVYVLRHKNEIVAVFAAYNKAFALAERREGVILDWARHDSHGVSWSGEHGYSVEEHEVTP